MYETPTVTVFDEMRSIATEIWNTYSDEFGYRSEKLNYINSLENIQDNAMVFYRMFDYSNKKTFLSLASDEVKDYINNNQ